VNRALYAAASGMAAQQQNLDVIADNLANADVAGFKGAQATFAAIGSDARLGTASTGVRELFTQGKLMKSGGPFDVAIDGAGFFPVERDGERGFTRAGAFARASDGSLRTAEGWTLRGARLPADAVDAHVAPDGRIEVRSANGTSRTVGRIVLVAFAAPERLRPIGSAVFAATVEAGPPERVAVGAPHGPTLAFGMLEKSNVSIVEAMMAILAAQRAYEANAKGVQAADEMMRIASNLQRQ
jgi:flagellar basal-body rod protein FlgG